ncbi:hypothetical protein K470DRAFT_267194 [Piedraia hortae CBS 480.64]|uniref:Uncharacterized protein n=1 Tax=Piedraia hortae CBS 480.64 TaxID=1314780 RepID=A0A6A7CD58_9PEZI|nr:hypothetical protein K470DRAFT_267194 [Piedraia hortae CBS 480.64]
MDKENQPPCSHSKTTESGGEYTAKTAWLKERKGEKTLKVKKTRENLKQPLVEQESIGRRMLSRVGGSRTSRTVRSTSSKTLLRRWSEKRKGSEAEVEEAESDESPPRRAKSVFIQPRPTSLCEPLVDLDVSIDYEVVDASTSSHVWVAVRLRLRSRPCTIANDVCYPINSSRFFDDTGTLADVRFQVKSLNGCRVNDIIGTQKYSSLKSGQSCVIYVRVFVPEMCNDSQDPNSLFLGLESMLGTLEVEILKVELLYQHGLQAHHGENAVRRMVSIRRPDLASHWSSVTDESASAPEALHVQIANFIADNYPPERALLLIDRVLSDQVLDETSVSLVRQQILEEIHKEDSPLEYDELDDAQRIWRQIRRSSIPHYRTVKRNESLLELQRKAVSNRRSVGEETLDAWKKEDEDHGPEFPWF